MKVWERFLNFIFFVLKTVIILAVIVVLTVIASYFISIFNPDGVRQAQDMFNIFSA